MAGRRYLRTWMITMLIGVSVPIGLFSQSSSNEATTTKVSSKAEIERFFVEEPQKNSAYETGPLHIVYGDGAEIVKTLPPLRESTQQQTIFNAVGFSGVQLATDRQTLGWEVNVQNCCTSYSIPMSLVVFRNRRVLNTFEQGQMIWDWMFLEGGERVAAIFGPTHGTAIGDYRLYSVTGGKLISEVWSDERTQALEANAPEWAKRLQDHWRKH